LRQTDSQPASFLTLEPGTPVVDRFGRPAGEVERVLLFEGSVSPSMRSSTLRRMSNAGTASQRLATAERK
jgi:hypothetical protein